MQNLILIIVCWSNLIGYFLSVATVNVTTLMMTVSPCLWIKEVSAVDPLLRMKKVVIILLNFIWKTIEDITINILLKMTDRETLVYCQGWDEIDRKTFKKQSSLIHCVWTNDWRCTFTNMEVNCSTDCSWTYALDIHAYYVLK